MDQQDIISLLEKAASGSITEAEQQMLAEGLREVDEASFTELVQQHERIVLQAGNPGEPDTLLYERIRNRITAIEKEMFRPVARWKTYAAAAAILVLLLAGGIFWYFDQPVTVPVVNNQAPGGNKAVLTLADGTQITLDSARIGALAQQGDVNIVKLDSGQLAYEGTGMPDGAMQYNTLTIPRGGQFQLTLPDGTKVWLNSVSSLKYPVSFNGKERVVELQGQGYFEIAQQPDKPFRLKVGDMEVQVLGTRFDIMAYEDEHAVHTTLLQGSVRVKQGATTRLLRPGQQAVRDNATRALSVRTADIDNATAWKSGFFEFDDADLPTILRQISRWYDVEMIDQTKGTTGLFWGRVNKNLPLSSVLKLLASNGVHFRIEGKKVIIFQAKK